MADRACVLNLIFSQNSLILKRIKRLEHNYFKLSKTMYIDSQPVADNKINNFEPEFHYMRSKEEFTSKPESTHETLTD